MDETVRRVAAFIDECREGRLPDEAAFDALALEVFAFQLEQVPLYGRLCEIRGVGPRTPRHWWEIPAAPADLFKEDLTGPATAGGAVFLSSGTSLGNTRRSRHAVGPESLDLYRRSSMSHFQAMVLPDRPGAMSTLVLGPTSLTHPASSLGHMYGWAVESFAADGTATCVFDADGALDVDAAVAWLEEAAAGTAPVLLLALTSTLTAVFEALRTRKLALRLPADSRLVDTGGSKGGRTFSRNGILKAAWRFLHIPAYNCMGEYGMTELLSQFYDNALHSRWSGLLDPRVKLGPAWVRTVAVDPTTLAPLAKGERGILRHFDLANCESVSAVQTLDVGAATGEGGGFEVFGRAAESEARGCSQLLSMVSAGEHP